MSDATITHQILALCKRPSARTLARAVMTIHRQGRTAEVAYGAVSMLLHRPGKLAYVPDAGAAFETADQSFRGSDNVVLEQWLARFPRVARWLTDVPLRVHCAANVGQYTIAGEYGEESPRLFLMDDMVCKTYEPFKHSRGVRHIHCIQPLSPDSFMVTTGDSRRFAEEWRITNGELHRERRVLNFFGGFTAATTVKGRHYFGSDYSGRPNYLWRREDGKRFFLPEHCFRMFIDRLEAFDDRFILVAARDLDVAGGARAVTVFDTRIEQFVARPH